MDTNSRQHEDNICVICMVPFDAYIPSGHKETKFQLSCGHRRVILCLWNWMTVLKRTRSPLCRTGFPLESRYLFNPAMLAGESQGHHQPEHTD